MGGKMLIPGMAGLVPDDDLNMTDVFYTNGAATVNDVFTWHRPVGARFVAIWGISGGGGGGGGLTGATSTARGGGSGGGAGATTCVGWMARHIPRELYIQVGKGGAGGAASGAGSAGSACFVWGFQGASNQQNLIFRTGHGAGGGGGQAGTTTTNSGGSSESNAGGVGDIFAYGASLWFRMSGSFPDGSVGGTGATPGGQGGSMNAFSSNQTCHGGGGGGGTSTTNVDHNGGGYNAATFLEAAYGAVNSTAGTRGSNGFHTLFHPKLPFFSFGGVGGNSSAAGTGGPGGDAAFGSGGGGGGGGITGGAGGRGGDGLVIITCW